MSHPNAVDQAHLAVQASLAGERLGFEALGRISAGTVDPDTLLWMVLRAAVLDGWTLPPGPALRSACRAIQKYIEAAGPNP